LQSAADAAVVAAMPIFKASGFTPGLVRATAVASANGYTDGVGNTNVQVTQPLANDLQVAIRRTYPTFFGGILGFGSKSMTGLSKGRLSGGANSTAIHANDTAAGCSAQYTWNVGVNITGAGRLLVNGDIEAQNKVEAQSSDGTCTPAVCKVTGTAKSPCAVYNDSIGNLGMPITASVGTPDPLVGNTLLSLGAFCTAGSSIATAWVGAIPTTLVGGCDLITPGVYCSNANLAVNPTWSTSFCPSFASFVSAGQVQIGGNGAITITAAAGMPNQIIAYSDYIGGGPAIQLANGPTGNFTLTGSIYAPRGLINLGTGTPGFTMTGMLVGDTVSIAMGPGQPWTFNSPGGGTGPGWSLVQ
jgi:hypothetical protein